MNKYVDYIKSNKLGLVYTDHFFSELTTLKIGGKVSVLYYPHSLEQFVNFYNYYNQFRDCPIFILGNGSNVLASSNGYNGIVICFKKMKYKYSYIIQGEEVIVNVNSGVLLMDVINYFKKINIGGLEKLSYIPGTIGGIVKMNAGAFNDEIGNYIKSVTVLEEGKIKKIEKISFNYRTSNINSIILEVELCLKRMAEQDIELTINKIKKSRLDKQPIMMKNAGSTFKNFDDIKVWKLIDELGLRGYTINDAAVSTMHTNFLVNKNNCKSDDMLRLIELIKEQVYEKYKIALECEWIILN
ncbi:MAG: UDP-N-acetylmuramate dehydrogenase [Acholeplasmataceae bacterium]|nr:UDP-N-acetylmuramate dehydrogenase [Acholeplasmataceae bacterium]